MSTGGFIRGLDVAETGEDKVEEQTEICEDQIALRDEVSKEFDVKLRMGEQHTEIKPQKASHIRIAEKGRYLPPARRASGGKCISLGEGESQQKLPVVSRASGGKCISLGEGESQQKLPVVSSVVENQKKEIQLRRSGSGGNEESVLSQIFVFSLMTAKQFRNMFGEWMGHRMVTRGLTLEHSIENAREFVYNPNLEGQYRDLLIDIMSKNSWPYQWEAHRDGLPWDQVHHFWHIAKLHYLYADAIADVLECYEKCVGEDGVAHVVARELSSALAYVLGFNVQLVLDIKDGKIVDGKIVDGKYHLRKVQIMLEYDLETKSFYPFTRIDNFYTLSKSTTKALGIEKIDNLDVRTKYLYL